MSKEQLRAACQKISRKTGLSFNAIQTHYFLEKILEKIAKSEENHNFIFKGGFLLANVIGLHQRSTVDIDFLIRSFELTKDTIRQKFEKILNNDDEIVFEIQGIEDIRKEDKYGGYRIRILCKLENIRQTIPLDIATGDPITPSEIRYKYKSVFEDKSFEIYAYNLETILAEKLQTIYQRSVFNSRSKDFYDIHILYKLNKGKIDYKNLHHALKNTFDYRNTSFEIDDILRIYQSLKGNEDIKIRWIKFQERFSYAKEINIDDAIDTAIEIINLLE
ncbi:MAG: nucleotidyl transferase AbiEii/AbiGii toxin family protein [Coriobacteriia bacterium]|nr:nucleotidyl transferase AbiEii/AbiGii toxin family protein [Coriobacteriia bacterium]